MNTDSFCAEQQQRPLNINKAYDIAVSRPPLVLRKSGGRRDEVFHRGRIACTGERCGASGGLTQDSRQVLYGVGTVAIGSYKHDTCFSSNSCLDSKSLSPIKAAFCSSSSAIRDLKRET